MRTFFSKCTPQAIEYLDLHVKEWVEKTGAKVIHSALTFGTVEGKGGQKEPQLFVTAWYESGEAK